MRPPVRPREDRPDCDRPRWCGSRPGRPRRLCLPRVALCRCSDRRVTSSIADGWVAGAWAAADRAAGDLVQVHATVSQRRWENRVGVGSCTGEGRPPDRDRSWVLSLKGLRREKGFGWPWAGSMKTRQKKDEDQPEEDWSR